MDAAIDKFLDLAMHFDDHIHMFSKLLLRMTLNPITPHAFDFCPNNCTSACHGEDLGHTEDG